MREKSYPLGGRVSPSLFTRVVPPARILRKTFLAGGVALAVLAFGFDVQAANTADNYTGSSSGSLLTTGNWSLNAVPTVANDAVFTATTGIRTLTAGNLTVGSFNVTTNGGTFGIRNATATATDSILTLGGSGDLGNGVTGTAAGDLLYVASGATFNIHQVNGGTGSGTVKLALGQSGNFNAAGTLNIYAAISGSGFGITKTGAGTLTLTNANNTYSGDTTISTGTLALATSGAIASSPNIIVEGSGTFDVSGLSSTLTLGAQTLKGPSTAATGTIKAGASVGLTLGSTSSLTLPYFAPATPALTVSGGALTLNSATTVSVVIKNSGTPLAANDYKLISKGTGGSVAFTTTAPSVTVNGTGSDGIASGTTATLIITSGELYLHVSCTTPVGGTATATAATVCSGSGTTITLTSYTGTIQWYSSTDGSTYNIVSGQTSATLSTGNLTQKTWYRATVTSGVCGSADSSVATVDVSPTSVGGTATATLTTVCTGSGTTITLTDYTGTIQWYSSTDGSTYNIVSGQTSATLSTGNLTQKTWYRATVTSGVCSSANSSVATVDIYAANGVSTQATNAAPWSGRSNFGAVAFNGQMWVLGGYDGSNSLNDVWSSSNGVTWTQATNAAPWSRRLSFGAVVLNGQMWVLGGGDDGGLRNDVWSSSNGVTWTQVTNAAPWSRRFKFGAVVLNGQMWVLGGEDGGLRNDVWSSSDGMTWTQVTNAAPWSRRYKLGAVEFNGQMWVLGGEDGGFRNDVWSSSDGMTWTQVTNAAPWSGRSAHQALALNEQMWVLGGHLCSSLSTGCYSNDVWSSSDGVNWTLATNAAAWSARGQFGAVALNGQMWVLGGWGIGESNVLTRLNDVWFSGNTLITCPDNIVTNISGCSATVTYPPATATNSCSGISTNYCSPASGSSFPAGVNIVTCTAKDGEGNTATSWFTISVLDSTPPTISCPADITTDADPPCGTTRVVTFAPTASANCTGVTTSCSPASGSAFPQGTNTVNCTAIDASGNTAGCSFKVIVNEHAPTPAAITCPANIVTNITPNCAAAVTYAPTATAACGATLKSVRCKPASGSTFLTGTTTVNCTAIDSLGNTNMCSFTVTVLNTEPTALMFSRCPANFTVNTCVPKTVTWARPMAVDACGAKAIATNYCVPRSGTIFDMGTTPVECTAQDKSGNIATCSFTVELVDPTRPTMKGYVKNECVVQGCDELVSYTMPGATDKCGAVTLVCNPSSGTTDFTVTAVAATNLVTCIATDTHGNSSNTSWKIVVNRRLTPKWMAPLSGNDLCFVADTDAEPTNTFTAGQIVTNQVKLYNLSGADVTGEASTNVVVKILFSLRNQTSPASSTLITNVVALVPKVGRGTKGSNLNPAGTMKYIADGQYFAFDVITTNANWDVNTLGDSTFYRATVTVTPKPACTKSTVGTGAVRLETIP
jgi:autotransporter-associated beta strand protein